MATMPRSAVETRDASPSQAASAASTKLADHTQPRGADRRKAPVNIALSSSAWMATSDSGPIGVSRRTVVGSVINTTVLPSARRWSRSASPRSIASHSSVNGVTRRSGAQRSRARPS
jgi:hypothetical protein